jgi:hypothetical protein
MYVFVKDAGALVQEWIYIDPSRAKILISYLVHDIDIDLGSVDPTKRLSDIFPDIKSTMDEQNLEDLDNIYKENLTDWLEYRRLALLRIGPEPFPLVKKLGPLDTADPSNAED